jgi:CBS domain-containing protein
MLICEIPNFIQDHEILTLSPESMAQEAMEIIDTHNVGAIPILDGDNLVGIFSERDLIKRVFAKGLDPKVTKMAEVMTPDPSTLLVDEEIHKAMDLMSAGGYRHIPLVDPMGNFTGILSQRDFMNAARLELIRYKATHKDQ